MVESEDTTDLKSVAEKHTGSSPVGGTIRIETTGIIVRFYDNPDTNGPFVGVMNVHVLNNDTLFVYGLHGTITRQHYTTMLAEAYDRGYRHYYTVRHGKWILKEIKKAPKEGL